MTVRLRLVLMCGACLLPAACGSSGRRGAAAQMEAQTVHILVLYETVRNVQEGGQIQQVREEGSGGASGFVIADGRYVVTNYHVCCDPKEGEVSRSLFVEGVGSSDPKNPFSPAVVKWSSKLKDLAVLELEQPSGRPAVTFAGQDVCEVNQPIVAVGFPGASNLGVDEETRKRPRFANGSISKFATASDEDTILGGKTRLYEIDGSINPGNSGGPIFDLCGRVVGIVSRKVVGITAEGVAWGIRSDELLDELGKLGLSAPIAVDRCQLEPATSAWLFVAIVVSTLAAVSALGLAITSRGREYVKKLTTRREGSAPAALRPVLKGVSGYYAGTELEINEETWTLGRDPRVADLAFPEDNGAVSKRHCTISYNPARRRFVLQDTWSTNGTLLESGQQIPPGGTLEIRPGDRFYLGTRENLFEVDLEGAKPRT